MTSETHETEKNNISLNSDHQTIKTKIMKWNFLFGHIGLQQIQKLLVKSAPECLLASKQEIKDCEVCLLGKEPMLNERLVIPLNLLVADLMGPFDVLMIHGGHYAINIWDVTSTYGKCHILSNKSDTSKR
ncbi:hypothetical protein O181_062009 [Austropuccinia psidii MF-1]|uniref:GAG-pre-integrase domain-containing protein n=1 Tax=Austropuccinia psidii MF-1 TaxID=1389203 RepID=A0A9Q3I154_9BASI|nr:hypothetical protein [Austropuccinia psidii MF-1]